MVLAKPTRVYTPVKRPRYRYRPSILEAGAKPRSSTSPLGASPRCGPSTSVPRKQESDTAEHTPVQSPQRPQREQATGPFLFRDVQTSNNANRVVAAARLDDPSVLFGKSRQLGALVQNLGIGHMLPDKRLLLRAQQGLTGPRPQKRKYGLSRTRPRSKSTDDARKSFPGQPRLRPNVRRTVYPTARRSPRAAKRNQ